MTASPSPTPSWGVLFVAALLIGPALLAGVYGVSVAGQYESRPDRPQFRPLTADPPLRPSGFIAYVARPPDAQSQAAAGCVWVVHASGEVVPRRLGCSGDGTVPHVIQGLSWTDAGDLRVSSAAGRRAVLRVYAGRRVAGAMPERRRHSVPRTAILSRPGSRNFAAPQWSPDGKWILVSDRDGRLLILDDRRKSIRELLGPSRSRRGVERPLLTWYQGSPR